MRTDRSPRSRPREGRPWLVGMAAAVVLSAPTPTRAQAPLLLLDAETRVRSVSLEFASTRTLPAAVIRRRIGLRGPRMLERMQGALAPLPFIDAPAPLRFSALEMARDAARIERLYRESGFIGPDATYDVRLDTAANSVDIVYRIDEGRPILLDTMEVVPAPESDAVDPTLADDWLRFSDELRREHGIRLGEVERLRLRSLPLEWLRSRGYAFASVRDAVAIDTATALAHLRVEFDAGPRARVDSIAIEGREALGYRTLRRELPIDDGDWYSTSRMVEGQRQVFGLALVRLALFEVTPDQPRDSTVSLQLRVQEGSHRLVSGELGYATERGAVAEGRWEHRDFLGGARTLTVSGVANTGWLAATDPVDRRFGMSTALRQPWLWDYRISGTIRPFVEYRDDTRDESFSYGTDASLLFESAALRRVSTTWTLSTRRIIDAPTLTARGDTPDTLLLSALPVELGRVHTHRLGLSAVYGDVDDPLGPRRGYITRGAVEVAGPGALSSVQYGRVEGSATGFQPLGRSTGLVARASAGRLFVWGESVPDGPDQVLPVLLRLRDAVFTAGGTGDVRGWGTGLLGPKVPDLRIVQRGDSVVASADRYLVLQGLARLTASLELRLPFPFLGPAHGTHLFIDAGRVWNPDDRFFDPTLPRDPLDQQDVFFGTGFGVEFGTLVGPLRIDLGYKLNPSPLDLRDPGAVARALAAGDPVTSVPTDGIKRWHLHLAIGRVY